MLTMTIIGVETDRNRLDIFSESLRFYSGLFYIEVEIFLDLYFTVKLFFYMENTIVIVLYCSL